MQGNEEKSNLDQFVEFCNSSTSIRDPNVDWQYGKQNIDCLYGSLKQVGYYTHIPQSLDEVGNYDNLREGLIGFLQNTEQIVKDFSTRGKFISFHYIELHCSTSMASMLHQKKFNGLAKSHQSFDYHVGQCGRIMLSGSFGHPAGHLRILLLYVIKGSTEYDSTSCYLVANMGAFNNPLYLKASILIKSPLAICTMLDSIQRGLYLHPGALTNIVVNDNWQQFNQFILRNRLTIKEFTMHNLELRYELKIYNKKDDSFLRLHYKVATKIECVFKFLHNNQFLRIYYMVQKTLRIEKYDLYSCLLKCFNVAEKHTMVNVKQYICFHIVQTTDNDLIDKYCGKQNEDLNLCTISALTEAGETQVNHIGFCYREHICIHKAESEYKSIHKAESEYKSTHCYLVNGSKVLSIVLLYASIINTQTQYTYLVVNSNIMAKDCPSLSELYITQSQLDTMFEELCEQIKDIDQPSNAISSDIAQQVGAIEEPQAEAIDSSEGLRAILDQEEHIEKPQSRLNGAKATELQEPQSTIASHAF